MVIDKRKEDFRTKITSTLAQKGEIIDALKGFGLGEDLVKELINAFEKDLEI